jgi:hypothetical protein
MRQRITGHDVGYFGLPPCPALSARSPCGNRRPHTGQRESRSGEPHSGTGDVPAPQLCCTQPRPSNLNRGSYSILLLAGLDPLKPLPRTWTANFDGLGAPRSGEDAPPPLFDSGPVLPGLHAAVIGQQRNRAGPLWTPPPLAVNYSARLDCKTLPLPSGSHAPTSHAMCSRNIHTAIDNSSSGNNALHSHVSGVLRRSGNRSDMDILLSWL